MPVKADALKDALVEHFGDRVLDVKVALDEVRVDVAAENLFAVCEELRDADGFKFDQLIDVCGVDYGQYGKAEWETHETSGSGFSRGRQAVQRADSGESSRFASVYHLLSVELNQRLRVHVGCPDDAFPMVDSVVDVWSCADWFERESFDLYGIVYNGHPDLRRILTDYGFVGHPFRKDFPISGHVEMRYDAEQGRVIYEPVSIEPRVLVPKVIRPDTRTPAPVEEAADAAAEEGA